MRSYWRIRPMVIAILLCCVAVKHLRRATQEFTPYLHHPAFERTIVKISADDMMRLTKEYVDVDNVPSNSSLFLQQRQPQGQPATLKNLTYPVVNSQQRSDKTESIPAIVVGNHTEQDPLQQLLSYLQSFNQTAPPATNRNASTSSSSSSSSPRVAPYMRACMIVRDDNYYMAEWIAYHYTVLPLRHLIVGCDYGSTQDPMDVLSRWNHTDLVYQVWYPEQFFPLSQQRRQQRGSRSNQTEQVHRQSVFLSKCMKYLHHHDPNGWVALVDPDEFIKLNPLDDAMNHELYELKRPWTMDTKDNNDEAWTQAILPFLIPQQETILDRIHARKELRHRLGLDNLPPPPTTSWSKQVLHAMTFARKRRDPLMPSPTASPNIFTNMSSYLTVLSVLEEYSSKYGTRPCHTMSRRRFSAVIDNFDTLSKTICRPVIFPNILDATTSSSSLWNVSRLSTIQFLYHDPIEEWAKVLVDLRRLPLEKLSRIEQRRNPHRPLDECPAPLILNVASLIDVNHYVNHWHVYRKRKGDTNSSLAK